MPKPQMSPCVSREGFYRGKGEILIRKVKKYKEKEPETAVPTKVTVESSNNLFRYDMFKMYTKSPKKSSKNYKLILFVL